MDGQFHKRKRRRVRTKMSNQKEWVYKRGYELHQTGFKVKWYHYIIFWMIIDVLLFYKKEFIELINNKGEVRRIYPTSHKETNEN